MMSVHRENITKDKKGCNDRFGWESRRLKLLFLSGADSSY